MPEISDSQQLIAEVHAAGSQIVLAITGGGSRAIGELLSVPGGSKTFLEAIVPYSAAALADFLKAAPEQFCSARTARAMAMTAFQRARDLQEASESAHPKVVGIGCTASLVSDRPKHGPHRIHAAWQTAEITATYSLELDKGHRTRAEEEDIAARLILNAIAEAVGLAGRLPLNLADSECIESTRTDAPTAWQELLLSRVSVVRQNSPSTAGHQAIFPGAFNPLHAGHLRMAEVAAQRLGVPVTFEISIENVDKPLLDYTEMRQRLEQFAKSGYELAFTRARTFLEKSRIFPGATFIVGADTLARIGQPKYYGDDPAAAEAAIAEIAGRGSRFLVFGRQIDGRYQSLSDLMLPGSLRRLCEEVPSEAFREDISSTELRRTGG
jgi:cytidyltransferase-like protein